MSIVEPEAVLLSATNTTSILRSVPLTTQRAAIISTNNRSTGSAASISPTTTTCISRSSSHHNVVDTDSGKSSSCSPGLNDCSFDSGIMVEATDMQLHKRLLQCKRILTALERNKESYRVLRERLSKIADRKNRRPQIEEHLPICNVCCAEINLQDRKSFVTCCNCKKNICRGIKCADWLPKNAEWECQLCQTSKDSMAHTSSWVAEQMSFNKHKYVYPMRARSEIYIPIGDCNEGSMQFESVSQAGGNSTAITPDQKIKIREFVEEVVAGLLGGSLDQIKVSQLSKSENYLRLFRQYHSKLSYSLLNLEKALWDRAVKGDLPALINGRNGGQEGSTQSQTAVDVPSQQQGHPDFSDISETRLRQLIQSIITETLSNGHSGLSSSNASEVTHEVRRNGGPRAYTNGDTTRRHRTEHYFEPKIYQDLLATAVLNKIAGDQNNSRRYSESTPDLSGHRVDANYNVENISSTSGSSIEPQSECSYTDTDHMLNVENFNTGDSTPAVLPTGRESALSDYIAGHMVPLPDLSVPQTESEEDDYASITSSAIGEGTWEDNWLFKKKRTSLNTSVAAGSTGMLVPAPKEDVRAQIGDKTADEVSDLSEIGSETDDSSLDISKSNLDPLNDRILNKQLIGGGNTKMILDELIDNTNTISTTPSKQRCAETKNEQIVEAVPKNEAINKNINSKPSEVHAEVSNLQDTQSPVTLEQPSQQISNDVPLSGSIAEREYKKWYNAVDMPNNPYAPEALKKRISGSQERFMDLPNISPSTEVNPIDLMKDSNVDVQQQEEKDKESEVQRYSRDYYINDSRQSSPTSSSPIKCASSAVGSTMTSGSIVIANITDEPTTDNIVIKEAENPTKTAGETRQAADNDIFQALPAQVVEESTSLESLSNQSLQSVNTTTSDDSDTVRIYDFKKQETTIIRDGRQLREETTVSTTNSQETAVELKTSAKPVLQKQRPTDLELGSSTTSIGNAGAGPTSPFTPTRGSTPTAFKFLQPKRKLIDPSQVLSFDEDALDESTPIGEKPVIENEVAQVLPSVKALAQAFLMTSNKRSMSIENRWKTKAKILPEVPKKPGPPSTPTKPILDASPASGTDITDDPTITSDLSSLEADPLPQSNPQKAKETLCSENQSPKTICTLTNSSTPVPTPSSDIATPTAEEKAVAKETTPVRSGILKSNIAFFENLKYK